ncbi:MAG: hypothetical protein IPM53_20290 [Anaerolineaceae bacterium]|nr:hypothetical protein [Anaerolineaceae bacterium]
MVNGRILCAWCALDTLFLPRLLAETAETDWLEKAPSMLRYPMRVQQGL